MYKGLVRCLLIAAVVAGLGQGCALPPRMDAVPDDRTAEAVIPGIPNARIMLGQGPDELIAAAMRGAERQRAYLQSIGHTGPLPRASFLAISGGGEDGAFGAGLLVGWTEAGTRPQFTLVTGISTGALTAPFAFLGPEYDDELRAVYTGITPDDVFEARGFSAALFNDAMSDTTPLRRTIANYADEEMLRRIAEEYERGRFLLIGTANLDARRPVIWNIGEIARSGHPDALDLFHSILVASAAVPGAFPPVMIDVEVDGMPYQEMHVDGGAVAQVFVYPPALELRALAERQGLVRDRSLYIIRNARLDPDWASTQRSTLDIAGRAISSLIQSQGLGDLYRIYLLAQRDNLDYNLAFIDSDFDVQLQEPFDSAYMRALFDYGYDLAQDGYTWHNVPPGWHDIATGPSD